MGEQRHLIRNWILIAVGALLAPAAAQAQVIIGLPISGNRPTVLPFYYPQGMGYGGYGYGNGYGYGGYGYGYGAPYGGYYPYANANPYLRVPTSMPITTGLLPYSAWSGLSTGGMSLSAAPRMRQGNSPYTGTFAGLTAQSAGYPGSYTTEQAGALPAASYAPLACASLVSGGLTGGPGTYAPVSYAANAVVSLGPPARLRQSNYPANLASTASLSASPDGLAMRRAEVDVLLPSPNAEIWFEGVKMTQTGKSRRFFTPRLEPGSRYTYEVRARWQDKGKTRELTRNIYLRAGDVLEVNLATGAAQE